jgi:hypothetical protein
MSKLLTTLIAIAFAAAASIPVAQAADQSAPMEKKGKAEQKKGETKKAAPKGDTKKAAPKGDTKKAAPKGDTKKKSEVK